MFLALSVSRLKWPLLSFIRPVNTQTNKRRPAWHQSLSVNILYRLKFYWFLSIHFRLPPIAVCLLINKFINEIETFLNREIFWHYFWFSSHVCRFFIFRKCFSIKKIFWIWLNEFQRKLKNVGVLGHFCQAWIYFYRSICCSLNLTRSIDAIAFFLQFLFQASQRLMMNQAD